MYLVALVLGAGYSLGFAPFDYWPLTCITLAGLFYLLHQPGIKPALVCFAFGLGKYGLGASWVYVSIHVYGNAPVALAVVMVVLFVATLAFLFSAPVGWIYGRLRPPLAWGVADVTLFAGAWVFMDWVSTWLFTGFPWLLPGYAFMNTFLLGVAPVAGVLGVGLIVIVAVAALTAMLVQRRIQAGVALLLLVPLALALGLNQVRWVEPVREYDVALVQGNLDQARKWLPEEAVPNVRKHLDLSASHWDADVIVWPEASVTMYYHRAGELLEDLGEQARATGTDLVLGIPSVEFLPGGDYEFQNTALGLGHARGRFAKYHLVPFGEYVPLAGVLRGLIEFFDLPMSRSTPGDYDQPNLALSFGEAALAICYEIAYPESMRQRGMSSAVLITISNDTWFGESIGPLQHMQIARMRAVENGRWLLRATNNGVTAIVAADGRVSAVLPQFEAGVLRGKMSVVSGRTPFSRTGHWPLLGLLMLLLASLAWRAWSAQRSHERG